MYYKLPETVNYNQDGSDIFVNILRINLVFASNLLRVWFLTEGHIKKPGILFIIIVILDRSQTILIHNTNNNMYSQRALASSLIV